MKRKSINTRVSFNGKTALFRSADCRFDSGYPLVEHKNWVLPDIDLSHDEGDPRYLAHGTGTTPVYREDGTIKWYTWNGLKPGFYAEYYQLCIADAWEKTVLKYEADPENIYRAWWYVDSHPIFWYFSKPREERPDNHVANLVHEGGWVSMGKPELNGAFTRGWPEVQPHMICPVTRRVEEDASLNTELEWWYEFGPMPLFPEDQAHNLPTHDYELDGGAPTYEQCVIGIAGKIHMFYGNDRVCTRRFG